MSQGLTLTRKTGERIFIFEPLGQLVGVISANYKSSLNLKFPPNYAIQREETLDEKQKQIVRGAGYDV